MNPMFEGVDIRRIRLVRLPKWRGLYCRVRLPWGGVTGPNCGCSMPTPGCGLDRERAGKADG